MNGSMLQMDLQSFHALESAWNQAPHIVTEEMTAAMWESELLLQRDIQEMTPVGAQGFLHSSIEADAPHVLANNVIGIVGTPLSYAEAVELGTKPHWAPIEPILDWVRHKLGISENEAEAVARRVQYNIAHHGTPAVGMFHRGFNRNLDQVERIFSAARNRIAVRMAGGAA